MRHVRLLVIASLLFVEVVVLPARGTAQTPVDPGQLPGRTTFYLLWRGTPSGEIRNGNSLYALWDDPQFSSARSSFIESFLNDTQNQKNKPVVDREELAQYLTLLDNPFLIGYVRRPEPHAAVNDPTPKKAPAWNGIFCLRSLGERSVAEQSGGAHAWNGQRFSEADKRSPF
ncbi:MAG: hypothetical protein WBL63_01860 [Candidatus Acidiferrum sp.]